MTKVKWIVGVLAALLIILHLTPLVQTHSEQDSCSFGDVSNEEYRLLLARAGLGKWRPFTLSSYGVTVQLNSKYQELLPNTPSVAIKVATVHAVMRALGAEFRRFEDLKSRNPDAKIQRSFRYEYLLDINRLFYFSPFFRNALILVSIDNPVVAADQQASSSDLRIIAFLPSLKEVSFQVAQNSEPLSCPIIPPT
jgi:hypothetical protein